jgi:hypothetical protein
MTDTDACKIRLSRTSALANTAARTIRELVGEVSSMASRDESIEEIADDILSALVESIHSLRAVGDLASEQLETLLETDHDETATSD